MLGRLRRKQNTEESSQKTGAAWKRALGGIFGRSGIDDDFWEELEEALIVSDVGVKTTLELIERLREQVLLTQRPINPRAERHTKTEILE